MISGLLLFVFQSKTSRTHENVSSPLGPKWGGEKILWGMRAGPWAVERSAVVVHEHTKSFGVLLLWRDFELTEIDFALLFHANEQANLLKVFYPLIQFSNVAEFPHG